MDGVIALCPLPPCGEFCKLRDLNNLFFLGKNYAGISRNLAATEAGLMATNRTPHWKHSKP
jgi:hypothetical protein